jgi:hypothetical protein
MNSEDQFIYRQFRVSADRTTAIFEFTLQHAGQAHDLAETLTFPAPLLDTPAQQRSLRALHVALGISYYKLFVPPVIVQPYAMDAAEADFWNQVWHDGLGEFLYVNKLPVERVAQFAAQDGVQFDEPHTGGDANSVADQANQAAAHHGALLGIGGGKDSIVAGELLKALAVPVTGFVMATGEQRGQAAAVAQVMDAELLAVERVLDKQFMTLRELPGAYHGHVPISMIFGLVGTVLAIATGREYVIVANEASASIPRIQWGDRSVNHQWSKSFGFEQQLQQFVHMSIAPDVTYFSVIRQLTSIGVAKLFANFSQYFEVFTSDNSVFRIDPARRPNGRWSLESPKTLSSFLLLAPWLDDAALQRIFGGLDLLNDPSLQTLFLELTGVEGEQPLDCVGTVQELTLSVNLLAQAGRYTDTVLMRLAVERGLVRDGDWQSELTQLLQLEPDQALPERLHSNIQHNLQERLKI